ncbi:MAG: DNA mismatch repair protein MutS, partial [Bacteroidales bacterium]
ITPGVALNDRLLEDGKNNFLCGIFLETNKQSKQCKEEPTIDNISGGISFLDISTGEFYVAEGSGNYLKKLIDTFTPSEIVLAKNQRNIFTNIFGDRFFLTPFEEWVFKEGFAMELLVKHFKTKSLKGFGVDDLHIGLIAAASCLYYLIETKHELSEHVSRLNRVVENRYVWLDKFTIRNLELLEPNVLRDNPAYREEDFSLYGVLNRTSTAMGSRYLRRIITLPLNCKEEINNRLDYIEYLIRNKNIVEKLSQIFSSMGDTERLLSKIASLRAQPREVEQLKFSLERIQELKSWLGEIGGKENKGNAEAIAESEESKKNNFEYNIVDTNPLAVLKEEDIIFRKWLQKLDPCRDLHEKISHTLQENPATSVQKGSVIAKGVSRELDELREIAFSGKNYLASVQKKEIERSGIASLKLGFNNVYGYYLEVTHAHKEKVPSDWVRKQTLTTGERYITEELKLYEQKVLVAQEQILTLENKIYEELLVFINTFIKRIQINAHAVAFMDVMCSFAKVSLEYKYVRPEILENSNIEIIQGRHPVIERNMPLGENYVPNDVFLDEKTCQIIMITGPNMSGKSAVLRQTALIVLMAQIGCFVPANSLRFGLVDKIFTRVGATDNIASGESTFMVEMNETANILNNITSHSLVLLDEIGRGTSTYDGISIAWAIAEYLHEEPTRKAKVLFATHYHELNQMANYFPRIKNYHVKVKEMDGQIIFLRTLETGGSEHSFGIHVAQMAGMPKFVLQKAEDILESLEKSREGQKLKMGMAFNTKRGKLEEQLTFPKISLGDSVQWRQEGENKNISHSKEVEEGKMEGKEELKQGVEGSKKPYQLSFIQLEDPLIEKIKEDILNMDIDRLTPMEALNKLHAIKILLKKQ